MTVHWGGRGPGHMSRGQGLFNPLSLFSAGEKGGIWLPENSDVAVGSGVGTVTDISGNGKNATQGTAASKPILRQNATTGALYWEFDGVNDWLVTAAIDFSATSVVTMLLALRKTSDAALGTPLSLGTNTPLAGYMQIFAPRNTGAGGDFGTRAFNSANTPIDHNTTGPFLAPTSAIVTAIFDESAAGGLQIILRRNGVVNNTGGSGVVVGTNSAIYLGRRGGDLPFNGHIYGAVVIGRACTAAEIVAVEAFLNRRIGAF